MADQPSLIVAEEEAEQPFDASDPAEVNKARKKAGRGRKARLDFVAQIMAQREGRAWAHEFLSAGHVFGTSFVAGEPHSTSFREGERNMAQRLLADIVAAAPDQYVVMMREARGR